MPMSITLGIGAVIPGHQNVRWFDVAMKTAATFSTTSWTVVTLAADRGDLAAAAALEQLLSEYWYPIYAFVRRRGAETHAAQDLTQAFFADLLEREALKRVDRQRGRFRTFLLAALTNFLNNEWDKQQALKRGGNRRIISLDETVAETRYRNEPADLVTPEKLFERRWALDLLGKVLNRLKAEYAAKGKSRLFSKLEPCLVDKPAEGLYAQLAAALDMNEGSVRTAIHRLRQRYGELLRSEIADTVAPEEVEDEIRHLLAVVSS
jgi:RNA polymerase sigma factor (sigma-70 family)